MDPQLIELLLLVLVALVNFVTAIFGRRVNARTIVLEAKLDRVINGSSHTYDAPL